jgi:hypothetical protein
MTESSHCFQKCDRISGGKCLYNDLPEILGRLLCSYLHLASGADEVSGKSCQLVAAVHDEGAGLTFCG